MEVNRAIKIATEEIKKDEHLLLHAYPDPLSPLGKALGHRGILRTGNGEPIPGHLSGIDGKPWTIGFGRARNVKQGDKITLEKAETWLHEDVVDSYIACKDKLDIDWDGLNAERQSVLINMCYNLGYQSLKGFKNTLKAIKERRFTDAANLMLQSKWAKQVGKRAERLALRMKTGTL